LAALLRDFALDFEDVLLAMVRSFGIRQKKRHRVGSIACRTAAGAVRNNSVYSTPSDVHRQLR